MSTSTSTDSKPPPNSPRPPDTKSTTGSCLCGAITVRVLGQDFTDGAPRGHLCHCGTCRRSTGTDYAHNLRLPATQLQVASTVSSPAATSATAPKTSAAGLTPSTAGLTTYAGVDRTSGVRFARAFCRTCGSTITSTSAPLQAAGDIVVRMGLFAVVPPPASEMCAGEKVDWLKDKIVDF